MNTSSKINRVIYELVSYYIDNQLPFNIIANDKDEVFDLPQSCFMSENKNYLPIDIIEWNLETAEYDDMHLYITYVFNNEEIPLIIPFVNILRIAELTQGTIIFHNIFDVSIDDVTVDNTNIQLETYIKEHREEIEHSISCLKLVKE